MELGLQGEEMVRAPSAAGKQQARAKGSAATPAAGSSRPAARSGKVGPCTTRHRFHGVRQRQWGKWVAEFREPNRGRRHWLGTFKNAVDAALAYDRAVVQMYGNHAGDRLNFPAAAAAATPTTPQRQPAFEPPAAATNAFEEHEVKPVVAGTQGQCDGPSISTQQQGGSSCAVAAPKPEETWDVCFGDAAMYVDFDAIGGMVPCYPGVEKEDCQVDGFDVSLSPLWALDD